MKRPSSITLAILVLLLVAKIAAAACTEHTAYTGNDTWNNVTTLTLHMPTGTPASANDVCLATLAGGGNSGAGDGLTSINTPVGWTKIYCTDQTVATETICYYYRIATGSDAATYAWTTGDGQYGGGVVDCASGCNTSSPIDSGTTSANSCYALSPASGCSVPAATLANAGDLVITSAGTTAGDASCNGTNSWSTIGGYTARTSCGAGGTANGVDFGWMAAFDQAFASSGTTGTFDSIYGGATSGVAEAMVALAPGASAAIGAQLKSSTQLKGPTQLQ